MTPDAGSLRCPGCGAIVDPEAGRCPYCRVRYRPCLRCGKMMNRVNFGTLSGAVVDVCRGHGTFLDAGELHQIVTFIQDGGLERARRDKLEQLRDEERKLKDHERKIARDRLHRGEPASLDGGDVLFLIDLITGHH